MDAPSNDGLLRPQVFEHAANKLYGDVLVHPKLSHALLTSVLAICSAVAIYLCCTVQWTTQERIDGTIEHDARTSAPVAVFYLPADALAHVEPGQTFFATVEGVAQTTSITVQIAELSDRLETSCPICSPAAPAQRLYVRASATLSTRAIDVHGKRLGLTPGVRLHFELPTERQSVARWFGLARA